MGIAAAVDQLFNLIFLILFVTIALSWIPNINWYNEPFKSLKLFSEIFLAPFRKIIPPIQTGVGMMDISPIFAFLAYSILRSILVSLLRGLGL